MGFLRLRSKCSRERFRWVNSIEASGSKSCSRRRNSGSLILGVLQSGCRAGLQQYGSCSSAAWLPRDLGKPGMARSRRTSLLCRASQPSRSLAHDQPQLFFKVEVTLSVDVRLFAQGQSRRFRRSPITSGLPRRTDIPEVCRHVSDVRISDVFSPIRSPRLRAARTARRPAARGLLPS